MLPLIKLIGLWGFCLTVYSQKENVMVDFIGTLNRFFIIPLLSSRCYYLSSKIYFTVKDMNNTPALPSKNLLGFIVSNIIKCVEYNMISKPMVQRKIPQARKIYLMLVKLLPIFWLKDAISCQSCITFEMGRNSA